MSMLSFKISDALLRKYCEITQLPLREMEGGMTFFGIRGALPFETKEGSLDYAYYHRFKEEHKLKAVRVNYFYPRCVIGQWLPKEKKVAVFPGSTVPNLGYVHHNEKRSHQFNQLVPGCYKYRKGQHPLSDDGFQPHLAFRMQGKAVVRRANYEIKDSQPTISYAVSDSNIMVSTPADNIHAARNNPQRTLIDQWRGKACSPEFTMNDFYSSYGCQVIVGNAPKYVSNGNSEGDWNAWNVFQQGAYGEYYTAQQEYKYMLLTGLDAYRLAEVYGPGQVAAVLRFGSQGDLVEQVQQKLKSIVHHATNKPYYEGDVDGDYGPKTAEAVLQFQKNGFNGAATSFVGIQTAKLLGIANWPTY